MIVGSDQQSRNAKTSNSQSCIASGNTKLLGFVLCSCGNMKRHNVRILELCTKISTILKQELWTWVGKIMGGIGLNFFWVGNTHFHSIEQMPTASMVSVN